MAETLKPCPFCGGKARFETYGEIACAVVCQTCRCGTSTVRLDDGMQAVAAWNRRAERMCKSVSPYGFNDRSDVFSFKCSKCGAFVDSDDMGYSPLVVDKECEPLRFCPSCGARIAGD